jgi:quercetin dioxygenase-like cupin family protein
MAATSRVQKKCQPGQQIVDGTADAPIGESPPQCEGVRDGAHNHAEDAIIRAVTRQRAAFALWPGSCSFARETVTKSHTERMMTTTPNLRPVEAHLLHDLILPTPNGISSRVVAKASGGNVTLFAFDDGQGLTEHTSPYDALVVVLEGTLRLTVGGQPVTASAGTVTRMPAQVPHAVEAAGVARMLLVMLRDAA